MFLSHERRNRCRSSTECFPTCCRMICCSGLAGGRPASPRKSSNPSDSVSRRRRDIRRGLHRGAATGPGAVPQQVTASHPLILSSSRRRLSSPVSVNFAAAAATLAALCSAKHFQLFRLPPYCWRAEPWERRSLLAARIDSLQQLPHRGREQRRRTQVSATTT